MGTQTFISSVTIVVLPQWGSSGRKDVIFGDEEKGANEGGLWVRGRVERLWIIIIIVIIIAIVMIIE